ncbi:MAG: N-acetylmuramoyl-L-alanine amidase [Endomicrobium sp.]|jgi:N-acetylmuramoyl-L-alanine amidase|nr:N-acetylmuramoyl-L-alanine amidase [Endomicrobium sp.]
MKSKILVLFIILQFNIISLYAKESIIAHNVKVSFDNKILSKIVVYKSKLSKIYYLPINDIVKIYHGKHYYIYDNNVCKIVKVYIKNNEIILHPNSKKVIIRNKTNFISSYPKLINKELYVPDDFFSLKDFTNITSTTMNCVPKIYTLNIVRIPNITVVEYCLSDNRARISLHCIKLLNYTVLKKTEKNIVIKIFNGKVLKKNFININDGVINNIICNNDHNDVIIKINLQAITKRININMYKNKININITHLSKKSINNLQKTYYFVNTSKVFTSTNNNNQKINNATFHNKKKKKVIVIDAGHGGQDSGAIGITGTKEKDINLLIAKELKKIFEKHTIYKIILTRSNDKFISLENRISIANKSYASLFVSIHCNASQNINANGFEIYFLSDSSYGQDYKKTSIKDNSILQFENNDNYMLKAILHSMAVNKYINEAAELCNFITMEIRNKSKMNNRGIKQANFYVLKRVKMPAILIESAFLSNYIQEKNLNSKKFRNIIVNAIYKGIINYYKYIDKGHENKTN